MRLTTQEQGEHHVTVPSAAPVRLGTLTQPPRDIGLFGAALMRVGPLAGILAEVAQHFDVSSDELARRLFGPNR